MVCPAITKPRSQVCCTAVPQSMPLGAYHPKARLQSMPPTEFVRTTKTS